MFEGIIKLIKSQPESAIFIASSLVLAIFSTISGVSIVVDLSREKILKKMGIKEKEEGE